MSVKSYNTSRDFSTLPQVQKQLRESNGFPAARAAAHTTATLAAPALPGLASAGIEHTCVLTPTAGSLPRPVRPPLCPWQIHPEYDTGEGHVLLSWESPILPSQVGLGSDMSLSCLSPMLVHCPEQLWSISRLCLSPPMPWWPGQALSPTRSLLTPANTMAQLQLQPLSCHHHHQGSTVITTRAVITNMPLDHGWAQSS